jgi:ribosomal-protein-alanine N-acetyltransferase
MKEHYESERMKIECLTSNHAQLVLNFYKENSKYFDMYELTRPKNFYTTSYQTAVLYWEWKEMEASRCLRYFLFLKQDPSFILGTVNISNIRMGCLKKASIGYKIDHRYWSQGYATEACDMILDIVFREYGLHRIEAEIAPGNGASLRVAEKLGFTYEGLEYESAEINGKWQDLCLYSKLTPYTSSTIQ